MKKRQELIRNTAILSIGVLFTRATTFLLLPLYTIYISPTEYGIVDLIVTYVAYLAPLIILQSDWAVFKFLIDAHGDEKKIKQITSTSAYMASVFMVISVAALLALNLFISIPYIIYIVLLLLASILTTVILQYARGLSKNIVYSVSSIISGVVGVLGFFVFVVWLGLGIKGILLSSIISQLVGALYAIIILKVHRYINIADIDRSLSIKMLKYSWPLAPEGVSWWVMNASDRTIISIIIGVAGNGIYAVANKYASIITIMFGIFNLSWSQSISAHINDKDDFISEVISAATRLFSSIGLILIAILPLIFSLLINKTYSESYLYMPILVLANVFYAIAGIYSGVYIAKNLTKQIAKTTIAASIINIFINLALIFYIGIFAAALSTLIAYVILAVYRHYDAQKYVSITYDKKLILIMVALYILTTTMYYINDPLGNIASIIVTIAAAITINYSIINVMKSKIMSKLKPLTADQTVTEEMNDTLF